MKYKVWIEIEENNDDHYTDVGEPIDVGVFDTQEEAEDFQSRLCEVASGMLER